MPVSARERGSSRYNGRKHSGRGAWKKIEGIPLQATIVQPKTYLIMKARVYLSLGALLLFLAPLGCSDKAESPAPEAPPTPEPEKPEFVDKGYTMEENIDEEDPDCYYTYFRMQNASPENVIFFISTKMSVRAVIRSESHRENKGLGGRRWRKCRGSTTTMCWRKIWMRWDSLNCISILTWKED